MVLEGECADGQRAGSLGPDAAVRKEHGSLVELLCRRILLTLEMQGALQTGKDKLSSTTYLYFDTRDLTGNIMDSSILGSAKGWRYVSHLIPQNRVQLLLQLLAGFIILRIDPSLSVWEHLLMMTPNG